MKAEQVELFGAPKAQKELVLEIEANSARIMARVGEQCQSCDPELWVSFFFDGTRNSRFIDSDEFKHTNVVRLYLAHVESDAARNTNREYITGVGTEFKDDLTGKVLDKGGDFGAGFATGGEARLKWALERLRKRIQDTLTRSPKSTIKMIHLAIFGFSRGAALARAFALRIAKELEVYNGGTCYWKQGSATCRIEINFMGLFDTVASISTPTSMRKKTGAVGAVGALIPGLAPVTSIGVFFTATADGHGAWGKDLRIPWDGLVKQCLHLVSAHELRDSFPLDLVAEKSLGKRVHTFANCMEFIYPGVHSDIGGGYHPGAQGRGVARDDSVKLSQIPLHHMFRAAWAAGVPLRNPLTASQGKGGKKQSAKAALATPQPANPSIGTIWGAEQTRDFALNPWVVDLFNSYLDAMNSMTPGCKSSLQGWVEAHMDLYYRWRATVLDQAPPQDDSREKDEAKRYFKKGTPKLNKDFKEDARKAWKSYNSLRSPYRLLLAKAWQVYRNQNPGAPEVLEDDRANQPVTIYEAGMGTVTLPPPYPTHLEAQPPNPDVCRFFLKLVHDSVADFWNKFPKTSYEMQTDDTRLCNPRVFYIGGDDRAEIAKQDTEEAAVAS